jgi:myo-inositol-1(or 4)-monophosphatase
LSSPGIADRLAWAEDVSARVGKMLLGSFRSELESSDKAAGIVTQLDTRAEALIAAELKASFPGDGLLAEEGTELDSTTGYRWIADPLDGTTNYVSGIPHFAVSLACLHGPEVAIGVVHSPAMAETFKVVRGERAMGPDGPMKAKVTTELKNGVFLLNKCYLPSQALWEAVVGLLPHIRAFRYLGCISLDIAYVAAGRVDGLILLPSEPWDIAAGLAMLEASGAGYSDLAGGPVPVGEPSGIVACAPELLKQVLPLVHFPN